MKTSVSKAGITAGRAVLVALLVAAVLFPALSHIALAGSYNKFRLSTSGRDVSLTGHIEFNVKNDNGYMRVGGNTINLKTNDHVKIVFDTAYGIIVVNPEGYSNVHIVNAHVSAIIVNGKTVAKDVDIANADNIHIDPGELVSTLKIKVADEPAGPTVLRVNDNYVIESAYDKSSIVISNIHPGSRARMEFNMNSGADHVRGFADAVYVNGAEAPIVTPLSVLGLLATLLVATAAARLLGVTPHH